jgi:hypothetical protein
MARSLVERVEALRPAPCKVSQTVAQNRGTPIVPVRIQPFR